MGSEWIVMNGYVIMPFEWVWNGYVMKWVTYGYKMNCNEMAFFVLGMKWVCKCYGYVIR